MHGFHVQCCDPVSRPPLQGPAPQAPRCPSCLASDHPLPPAPSLAARARHLLLCPPHGAPATLLTYLLALATVWAVAYCILGRVALPGTNTIEVGPSNMLKLLLAIHLPAFLAPSRITCWAAQVSIHGGTVFALLALLTAALLLGRLVELLHLPPLLGMLLAGGLVGGST